MKGPTLFLLPLFLLQGLVEASSPPPPGIPTALSAELLFPTDKPEKYKTETFYPPRHQTVTSLTYYPIPTGKPAPPSNSPDKCPTNKPKPLAKPINLSARKKPGFDFQAPSNGSHFSGRGRNFNFKDYMDKDKARLRPAVDVRVDAGQVDNVRPKRNYSMPYISRDPRRGTVKKHAVMAADLRFRFKKDTVMLEHFMNIIDDLKCDSKTSTMTLTFSTSRALSIVKRFWPDMGAENGFRLVSPLSGPECVVDDQRGVYKARVLKIDEATNKVYLNYTVADWQQVSESIKIQFGEIELENAGDVGEEPGEKLRRRTDEVQLQKRGFFKKLWKGVKKVVNTVVDAVKDVVDKAVDVVKELTTVKWHPSVSFDVGVGPWKNDESPFGPALKIFDSSNGGWPKNLDWKELNNIIVTSNVQTKLKARGLDRENLSFEDFMVATVEAEYELSKVRARSPHAALLRRADPAWVNFSAWCVNCFVKAHLSFSGGLEYFVLGFKLEELYVQFDGTLEQNFQLGLILKGNKEWTHSKEIIRVPIGPGIVIPGVFSLGCTLPVKVGVALKTDVSFVTLMGVNFKWAAMHAKIDIKNGKGESSGWDPVTTWTKPDLKQLQVSASAELSATVAFEVGVTVLGDVFQENAGVSGTVAIGERLTYNRPDLNSCTGVGLVTYIRVGIDAYVQRIKTWKLFEKVWDIASVCLWQQGQATTPVTPTIPTIQPSLTPVVKPIKIIDEPIDIIEPVRPIRVANPKGAVRQLEDRVEMLQ